MYYYDPTTMTTRMVPIDKVPEAVMKVAKEKGHSHEIGPSTSDEMQLIR